MAGEIRVSVGQFSSAGRKARNDDSYGVAVPGQALLASKGVAMAIADGMSSSEAAKTASETCVRGFLEDYFGTHESWAVKTSAGRVLTSLNRWLHSQSQRQFESENALVTTFSGLILKAGIGYVFHAGDTQIALIRAGEFDVLTQSHRVLLQRGREHLLRAVGAQPDLLVDYRELPVEDGDILVFTTDGVHDHVAPRLVQELVAAHADDLNRAAAAIAEAAEAAGSPDNLTCQIVRVDCAGKVDSFTYAERLRSLPFPPHLSAGMVLDGFRIVRELAVSARSQIYLAEDIETGGRVVLKTPSVNFEDDADYIRHFVREEWVGQLISSPHVLKVLRATRPRRFLYTLTEHVEGETLAAWMERHPRPALDAVRALLEQIARGLRAFHRQDILHQDLKPGNIMIDAGGTAKIIDFGSVRIAGLEELRHGARPALMGTRDYSAPEYLKGEVPTPRADLYSLGVIAYEMLTGKLPYGAGFGQDKDLARARYVPAGEHNPDIPAWVDFALERAVRVSPADRYDALSHFMADITKPSEEFQHRRGRRSLTERHPGLWLRLCLGLSVLANIALLFALKVK